MFVLLKDLRMFETDVRSRHQTVYWHIDADVKYENFDAMQMTGRFVFMRNNKVIGWTLESAGVLSLAPQKWGSDIGRKGKIMITLVQFRFFRKLSTIQPLRVDLACI